ncbi:MAG: hypothetical protein ACR2RA_10930 [Geminicoccaceae bacterium]
MKPGLRLLGVLPTVKLALCWPNEALAHASQQAFVLLLPTDVYISAGVAAVALTVLALFAVPGTVIRDVFRARPFRGVDPEVLRTITSLLSLALLILVLYIGLNGPRDPLSNLMPLAFWTVGWIGFVVMAGLFGDIWDWINPWTGLYRLAGRIRPLARLPESLGIWPAVFLLMGFTAFLLADVAPDDPARLAFLVGAYWLLTMTGLILCGPIWLKRVEFGTVLMSCYADLSPVRLRAKGGVGCPGWRLLERTPIRAGGVFALALLAVGSFDGLNETFWWLARIGVNPLAFPGRSAVIWPTLLGLIGAIAGLVAMFALAVQLGLMAAGADERFSRVFDRLAYSLLPIAFAYHIAHYLPTFLVNIQHTVAAISDPFAGGADLLGIQPFYVTTGFFNHIDTVRLIWLTQAGVVVIGHVWSVLLAHRIALDLFTDHRRAAVATLPLSLFMIAYTMLGLWLLATPKGA